MEITGKELGALLHGIHEHFPEDEAYNESAKGKIIYFEEDLLKIFEAIGLPEPIWGESYSVEEFKKKKDGK